MRVRAARDYPHDGARIWSSGSVVQSTAFPFTLHHIATALRIRIHAGNSRRHVNCLVNGWGSNGRFRNRLASGKHERYPLRVLLGILLRFDQLSDLLFAMVLLLLRFSIPKAWFSPR